MQASSLSASARTKKVKAPLVTPCVGAHGCGGVADDLRNYEESVFKEKQKVKIANFGVGFSTRAKQSVADLRTNPPCAATCTSTTPPVVPVVSTAVDV